MNGVTFSFMDTSSSETRFDIFVGALGSAGSTKISVVTISPGQLNCGRVANPISLADLISSPLVGQIREYGITATQNAYNASSVQNVCNATVPTATTVMTTFPYRIPFLTLVSGLVVSATGDPLVGVKIDICHVLKTTFEVDAEFCPVITLLSDGFGHFQGEIRVSDP
jgi:hypothetical protein